MGGHDGSDSAAAAAPMAAARGWAAGRGASGSLRLASARPRRPDRPSVVAQGDRARHDHVHSVGRPRGDSAPGANQPETSTRTNFKALITTKPLLLNLNRLHYTQDVIWNY